MNSFYTVLFVFFLLPTVLWSQVDDRTVFVYGNSLVNHEFTNQNPVSNELSAVQWLGGMVKAANKDLLLDGRYGFLRQFTDEATFPQWGFDSVVGAWTDFDAGQTFSEAGFNTALITPANFIQYQGPDEPYFDDPNTSPLSTTRDKNDQLQVEVPGIDVYIYEGWSDMGGFLSSGFPPTPLEFSSYHSSVLGDYHDWFLAYQDSLLNQRPDDSVRLIPVSSVMSNLLTDSQLGLDTILAQNLYEDDAPHGRPSIYFLAGMVLYSALYEEPAPASYENVIPTIIHPSIRANYSEIAASVWSQLLAFNDENGDSRVFFDTPDIVLSLDQSSRNTFLLSDSDIGDLQTVLDLPENINIYDVSVYDVNGTQLLDFTHLKTGLYFIQLKHSKTGKVINRRVYKI